MRQLRKRVQWIQMIIAAAKVKDSKGDLPKAPAESPAEIKIELGELIAGLIEFYARPVNFISFQRVVLRVPVRLGTPKKARGVVEDQISRKVVQVRSAG